MGRAVEAVLDTTPDSKDTPVWRLCQWATKYSLAGVKPARNSLGDVIYEDEGKKVFIGGPNSPNADLVLEIKGDSEYAQAARKLGQPWPICSSSRMPRASIRWTPLMRLH